MSPEYGDRAEQVRESGTAEASKLSISCGAFKYSLIIVCYISNIAMRINWKEK